MIDATHDAKRRSWVESANGHPDFPIQNLPFGIYSKPGERPRGGVAIGDEIFDLKIASEAGLFSGEAKRAAETRPAGRGSMRCSRSAPVRARRCGRASRNCSMPTAASGARSKGMKPLLLTRAADCAMHLPARIGGYTDFFAGIHHATNSGPAAAAGQSAAAELQAHPGRLSRPRVVDPGVGHAGAPAAAASASRRPRPSPTSARAAISTTSSSSASGSDRAMHLGTPIPIGEARDHIAGFCLLNDWSARDIQAWEYQPLGPFLAKNFASTVSPWVVTPEALAPFRTAQPPRPDGDPRPLDYLMDGEDQAAGAFGIDLEALDPDRSHADQWRRAASARRQQCAAISIGRWRRWSRTTPAAAATSNPAT